MADNTQVAGGTGDFIRDKDRAGVKTQILGIDVGIAGASEVLLSAANPLPVALNASPSNVAVTTGTLTAAGVTVAANVSTMGNGTIVLYGGTYTALSLAFEASIDGTNWFPIDATRTDGSAVETTPYFTGAVIRAWNFIVPGYQQARVRAVAITETVAPTVAITQGPFLYDPSPSVAPLDSNKATYSAALNSTNVAAAVTAAVPILEVRNAGTNLMRVTRLYVQLSLATAGTGPLLLLQKRSAVSTGGTAVAQTVVAHDSLAAATAAVVNYYTAAPTVGGSALGTVRSARLYGVATTLTAQPGDREWTFGNRPGQALLLRPGQSLNLQAQAAFGTAPTVTGDVEWTEEPV